MEGTFVDPETVKYYLDNGRYKVTKKILGKCWRKAHIVWTYANQISLEIFQRFLDRGYTIHHKNGNSADDNLENLELIKKRAHYSLHKLGKPCSLETRKKISATRMGKYKGEKSHWWGRKRTFETRRKISIARKGKCKGAQHYLYGKSLSLGARKKISEVIKKWWRERKGEILS